MFHDFLMLYNQKNYWMYYLISCRPSTCSQVSQQIHLQAVLTVRQNKCLYHLHSLDWK